MKIQKLLVLSALVLGLTACTKVQTVEYYSKNADQAKKVLTACEANSQKGKEIKGKELENCQNAAQGMMGGLMSELVKGL